jgi:hypothetical protein
LLLRANATRGADNCCSYQTGGQHPAAVVQTATVTQRCYRTTAHGAPCCSMDNEYSLL